MDNRRKSILYRLFERVNESVEWGLKQVKNPCPPRKKFDKEDSIHSSEGDLNEKIDNGVEIESETRMKIGEGPDAPNENIMGKDTPGEGTTGKDITDDKSSGKFNHCEPDGPYLQPDQICPHINEPPCCVIPFQDPCRPCCCEPNLQEDLEPCPPKGYLDIPREPTCGCDLCKKNNVHGKCCAKREKFFNQENNGARLERA